MEQEEKTLGTSMSTARRDKTDEWDFRKPVSTEPKLGTCDKTPNHLISVGCPYLDSPHTHNKFCVNWREGESAPAQPRQFLCKMPACFYACDTWQDMAQHLFDVHKVSRWEEAKFENTGITNESVPRAAETAAQDKCARCGCNKSAHKFEISRSGTRSGYCYAHPQDCPGFETSTEAMTAEQFWAKYWPEVWDCLPTEVEPTDASMFAEAYAAHVREAAQGEWRDKVANQETNIQHFCEKALAAERKLSELEKAQRFVGLMLDVQCEEAGDIDGATIEDWLISCGFYAPTVVTKSCDESEESSCMCAEVGFPTTCNKLTDIARAALASLRAESKEPVD